MRRYQTSKGLNDIGISIPEELDANAINTLYIKWATDPLNWMHYFFPHHFSDKSPGFHREIIDDFRFLKKTFISREAPRGSAKSTLGEFLSFHCAVFSGVLFVIFISKTEEIASKRIITIRHECEHNKRFKAFFGDLRTEKWGEKEFILYNEKTGIHCCFLARGLGQQILGIKYLYQRPNLIVIDDPEDDEIVQNVKNVDKNERWLTKEVEPALTKRGFRKLFFIGTPVGSDCLIERTKKFPRYDFKNYSIRTKQGLPLWNEYMNRQEIVDLEEEYAATGNLSVFYTEYLCDPLSPDTHPIREEQIKELYYDLPPKNEFKEWLKGLNIFFLVDLAVGELKRNAFSALQVVGVDVLDCWWQLEEFQIKEEWTEFAKDLYGFRDKWHPLEILVEEAGQQKGFWSVLRLVAEKFGYMPIHAIPVRPDKDKRTRIERLLPRIKYKTMRLLRTGSRRTVEQLIKFPETPHRDLIDCLGYGEGHIYGPGMSHDTTAKLPSWKQRKSPTDEEMDEEYQERMEKEIEAAESWELDEMED